MDINRALRLAISTGNVKLGMAQAGKSMASQEAKLLIVASNCPTGIVTAAKAERIPTYRFRGNNRELGSACGKPFSVSTVTILEEGDSEILALRPEEAPPETAGPRPPEQEPAPAVEPVEATVTEDETVQEVATED